MYGLQAGQENTVAAAKDALNQFNAANTQQTNLANQANEQAANTYNTQNPHLLTDILKYDYGFRGYNLSDWGAMHSTAPHARLEIRGGVEWGGGYKGRAG